jgi:hypothetical protein
MKMTMQSRVACLMALLAAGCATRSRPLPVEGGYPGILADVGRVPADFVWRQSIAARFRGQGGRFEAVLQKRGRKLLILGLTPMGTRAFLLEQEGPEVKSTLYIDRVLPFPPKYVALDVHRTFFLGLEPRPVTDGWHEAQRDGEQIRELWRAGRLVERRFVRLDQRPPGEIVIRYEGGYLPGAATRPGRILLDNGWFDYHLTIDTLEAEVLEPGAAPGR